MAHNSLSPACTGRESSSADAQMRAYLRAFATVVVPGSIISLALCVTALSGVLA